MYHTIKSRQRGAKLNIKPFATLFILILIAGVSTTLIPPAQAVEDGEWITEYRVEDRSSGQLLLEVNFEEGTNVTSAGIFGGAELKVTFTISIPFSQTTALFKLTTSMQHSKVEDRYWELISTDYELSNYNPNQNSVFFNPAAGELTMSCFGRIPTGTGATKPAPFILVRLTDPSGSILDEIKPYVISAEMDEYRVLLEQKEEKLQSLKDSGVAPGYIQLYENVLNQSKVEAAQGYADNAIALLNTLPASGEPAGSSEMLLIAVIGVLAAATVAFAFLFLRGRGKLGYITLVIEDQIRDLEGITLRTSRVDRTISSNLESVKERLKNIVGM
jgi:hypothetical protein